MVTPEPVDIEYYEERMYYQEVDRYYSTATMGKTVSEVSAETGKVEIDDMGENVIALMMSPTVIEFDTNPEDVPYEKKTVVAHKKEESKCKEANYDVCVGIDNSRANIAYNPQLWLYGNLCTKAQLWMQRQIEANELFRWACIKKNADGSMVLRVVDTFCEEDKLICQSGDSTCTEGEEKPIVVAIEQPNSGSVSRENLAVENFRDSSRIFVSWDKITKDANNAITNRMTEFIEYEWLGHNPRDLRRQSLMTLPNSNKFHIYLGRVTVFNYPFLLNGSCMYNYTITSSATYDVSGNGYALSSILSDFELNACDGTLRFLGTTDNTVITTYTFNIDVCLTRNPSVCNSWTENIAVKVDIFSTENVASQILSIPVDADVAGGDDVILSLLPLYDSSGNALNYNMTGDDFGLFYLGSKHSGTQRILAQDAIFPTLRRDRNLSTSATNYELRYVGTTNSSGTTSLSFSLAVYDSTGSLVSDESYSVPIAGTMAEYSTLEIPVVSESGTVVTVSQSDLFNSNISTDNSALAWQTSGSYDIDRATGILIGLLAGLFFVPGWIMIIYTFITDKCNKKEKSAVNWSKLLWWQWMFVVLAPVFVFLTKGIHNNEESNGKQYASSVFSQTSFVEESKTDGFFAKMCPKKTNKVEQDPNAKFKSTTKVMNTLKFDKQNDPAISSELRNDLVFAGLKSPNSLSNQKIERVNSWEDDKDKSDQKKTNFPNKSELKVEVSQLGFDNGSNIQGDDMSNIGFKSIVHSPDNANRGSRLTKPVSNGSMKPVSTPQSKSIVLDEKGMEEIDLSKIGKNINNIDVESKIEGIKKSGTDSLSKSKGSVMKVDSEK